ncbi:hypothetical protein LEP1GSC036_4674 [Leptospira weilii str. 2006001853]|uniref:Uncharacterized protein n=1 Tax=Leptospira weilii str. 2006001853 TaxID=1001589 RepID=A0A828Z8K4_9LEPT|nr:hypothetical protein LEP1GSC036_4674 [Leptospira weilii str. 2006001853]
MILSMIREEWNRFCASWTFSTRLPIPPFFEIILRNRLRVLREIVSDSHNKGPNFSFIWE